MTTWFYTSAAEMEFKVSDVGDPDNFVFGDVIGDFFSPVWLTENGVCLAGHHGYADDDIEAFENRDWPDELVSKVGDKLMSLETESSKNIGSIIITSGCLLIRSPNEEVEVTQSEIDQVIESQQMLHTDFYVLIPLESGPYSVIIDDVDCIDNELGSFMGRVWIRKNNL